PVSRRVDGSMPFAPARWDLRRILAAVAVQELAEVDRVVPAPLQPDRECVRFVERLIATLRRRVSADIVVVRVLARQEGCARRTAERKRIEVVVERHALITDQAA